MAKSSPVSPRDLGLKEKKLESIQEIEAAVNIMVRRLNDVYKYNRRDHDRLTEDVADVSEAGTLTIEAHTTDDTLTEAESGSVHTNLGASGTITITLPASASAGTYFMILVQGTEQLRIDPNGATMRDASNPGLDVGWVLWGSFMGYALTVVADSNGDWCTVSKEGSWTAEA